MTISFNFTSEQNAFQQTAETFALQEMAPHAKEWDEKHIFPIETLRKAAKLGFAGICVRSDVGGTELTRRTHNQFNWQRRTRI
jgi:alkylation response protein AidB-like acyl-CoA dehydrogenase